MIPGIRAVGWFAHTPKSSQHHRDNIQKSFSLAPLAKVRGSCCQEEGTFWAWEHLGWCPRLMTGPEWWQGKAGSGEATGQTQEAPSPWGQWQDKWGWSERLWLGLDSLPWSQKVNHGHKRTQGHGCQQQPQSGRLLQPSCCEASGNTPDLYGVSLKPVEHVTFSPER